MNLTLFQAHLRSAIMGLLMGITLSYIGFTSFDEVHKMFLFIDLRLLFTFAGAVAFAMLFFTYLVEGMPPKRKKMHPGIIPGGLLFGAGWALTGSCPSIALVQLGEGQLAAGFTVFGILFGVWSYRHVHRRFFSWDRGSCG
jgi:uncharacterized protein